MFKRASNLRSGRYSRQGFQQLPESPTTRRGSPNDATIDIPLTTVITQKGALIQEESVQDTTNEGTSCLRHPVGGRRQKNTDESAGQSPGQGVGTLTRMGRIYNKILNFSLVTRYFLYVLPLGTAIAVPIIVGTTAKKDAKLGGEDGVRIVWIFTWVEIVWISLWVSKLFAKTTPYIFQFLCGIVSSGTRKYALVLEALEIPLSLAGWALASLATFKPLMTQNPDQKRLDQIDPKPWEIIMQNLLVATMIASLAFLAEKVLIQLISINYHRMQYETRIKESKRCIHLLSLLYETSRALFPEFCSGFSEEDFLIRDSIDVATSKHGNNGVRSRSETPMRLLRSVGQNVGRVGDQITSAFGSIAHEVTGKQVFNPTAAHNVVVVALEKIKSSEALAKRMWMSCVVEGRDALYQEDMAEVLGKQRDTEAEECFAALDRDGNGDISLDEMISTVCEYGVERKAIANSLHDVDQAIDILDTLFCTVVFLFCVFIFVVMLNSSWYTIVAAGVAALGSVHFIYAASTQELFGSCIFLFVKHPFDVGDRVDISGEVLVVERIALLYTVFMRIQTHKTTQVPNVVLNSLWIDNISRSKAMREQVLMYVSFGTSLEDIQLLKKEMHNFVSDKDNARDFQPDVDVEVTGIAEMNKLELKVEIKHKSNWSNESIRASRRSKFMCALVLALRKIPIYAPGGGAASLGSFDQPTYSVSVSEEVAATNRDAFAVAKEAKRFVPDTETARAPDTRSPANPFTLNRTPTALTTSPMEAFALAALNARSPTADPAHDWLDSASPPSSSPTDYRSKDPEEVRGVLRRQTTLGKRKGGQTVRLKRARHGSVGGSVRTNQEGNTLYRASVHDPRADLEPISPKQQPQNSPTGFSVPKQEAPTGYSTSRQNGAQMREPMTTQRTERDEVGENQRWRERNKSIAMDSEEVIKGKQRP